MSALFFFLPWILVWTIALAQFTHLQKEEILKLHNDYRRQAEPPAANMRLMSWDSNLEKSAQEWAENCEFKHGFPKWIKKKPGQNLYIGSDQEGLRPTSLWYNEKPHYDFNKDDCKPGEQCGHYTQLMWGDSHLLGCGIAKCPEGNLIVCHYKPAGNVNDKKPYLVGSPCSQCRSEGFCSKGLCATPSECEHQAECTCPLKCHNCGVLDTNSCRCQCKSGWDSPDCSIPCVNTDPRCRKNPGFPNEQSCRDPVIKESYCRVMCRQCKPMSLVKQLPFYHRNITGEGGHSIDNICCRGVMCPYGYILDEYFCSCRLFCPGPKCSDADRLIESIMFRNLLNIAAFILIFYLSAI